MALGLGALLGISAGTQILGGLIGGGKNRQTTQFQMSPEARQLFNMYMQQLGQGTPSYLTDPINRIFGARAGQTRESMGEALGPGSGLEMARLDRLSADKGRMLGNIGQQHQEMLMRQLQGLVAPPGQTTTGVQGTNWGQIVGNIGGDFLARQGFQDYMRRFGGGSPTGGQFNNPRGPV